MQAPIVAGIEAGLTEEAPRLRFPAVTGPEPASRSRSDWTSFPAVSL
jgi:hypothetical protein